MNYTIQNDSLTVTVGELGAELISVMGNDGFEYIWQSPSKEFWGGHAPLLFPHCGRILNSEYTYNGNTYKMGSHGFARGSHFELLTRESDRLIFSISDSETSRENYPFSFELVADYRLENRTLFVNFTVQNTGKTELPYMLGWHPAFSLDTSFGAQINDFSIEFPGKKSLVHYPLVNGPFVSREGISYPISDSKYNLSEDEIYKNDTMIFMETGGVAKLFSPKARHSVTLSYGENLPYFCIWKYQSHDANFICLEPWSDVPSDGTSPEVLETKKMSRLQPGARTHYSYRVDFT